MGCIMGKTNFTPEGFNEVWLKAVNEARKAGFFKHSLYPYIVTEFVSVGNALNEAIYYG